MKIEPFKAADQAPALADAAGQSGGHLLETIHGGPDALGVPVHDFSTNANACGPCPDALDALRRADFARYPDPSYAALRRQLAGFHGVAPERVVIAASASEFIHRISALAHHAGLRCATMPPHAYGDYARAASVWGLTCEGAGRSTGAPALHWACEPSSPLGVADDALAHWSGDRAKPGDVRVLDCAYAPLRLVGQSPTVPLDVWQLWTPNKALGLTGVRAAYAVAPDGAQAAAAEARAPSWPLGADGVAMLNAWVEEGAQAWLANSLATLRAWKSEQVALCTGLDWQLVPGSVANFFVARLPLPESHTAPVLGRLRAQGVKLRDCASFGLPGHVRLGVLPPASQQALRAAWLAATSARPG